MKNTILITGGAGYVGYTLTEELLKKFPDSEILIYDNFSKGRLENIGSLMEKFSRIKIIPWEKADIRDVHNFESVLKEYHPGIVIHLAAIVDAFSTNREGKDRECMVVNYEYAVKIAELCKKNGVDTFIYQSSVSIYSRGENLKEDAEKDSLSTYGKAKYLAEVEILKLNNDSFKVCCLRPATIVGYNPSFRYETIINLSCIRSLYNLQINIFESALHGNKSYLDVVDNARVIIFCIENIDKVKGSSYNVSSFNTNLKEVIDTIEEYLNRKINKVIVKENSINQQVYTINSDKIKALGFLPKGELKNSIKATLKGLLEKKSFDKSS